jgi:hypothetical protein
MSHFATAYEAWEPLAEPAQLSAKQVAAVEEAKKKGEIEEAKIRAVMGEEEWTRNNGHICNSCSAEAGSSLRCRCMWQCKRHAGITGDPRGGAASPKDLAGVPDT